MRHDVSTVIAGLDPAIHEVLQQVQTVSCPVLRFIMDARDIGVRKHAVLRTAVPAHDAAVRHCLSTVMPRACRGLSSFRDGPKGRTRNPDARHRVRFWIPGSLAAARAPE